MERSRIAALKCVLYGVLILEQSVCRDRCGTGLLGVDRPEAAVEFGHTSGDVGDQQFEFLAQHIVRRLVPGEPRTIVVLFQSAEEFESALMCMQTICFGRTIGAIYVVNVSV